MRILHLLSQTELTGAEVYAQNLIRAQVQNQHQVHVISDRMHVDLPVPWLSWPLSTSKTRQRWKNIHQLREFLRDHQIDVIHCHSRGAVRHAHWARWGLPVAQVTTLHGRQHFSWSKRLLDIYGEIRLAVCENVKKAMELDFHCSVSAIRVSRNPVEAPPPIAPIEKKSGSHMALLGRSSGPKGERFEQIILHCFEAWLSEFPDLHISIIVPRPEGFSAQTRDWISDLNRRFSQRVHLRGHLLKFRESLPDFDLTLCSGRIAIESLLAHVPVFAIGEHSAPGLVNEKNLSECLASNFGDMGVQEVEVPLDVGQVQQSVRKFLHDPSEPREETKKIREKIRLEFDPRRIQEEVLQAYRAAIFKRHVPHWLPILMYHKIPVTPLSSRHRIFVTRDRFRKHLEFFRQRGLQTLTFQDLHEFWMGLRPYQQFPKKPLLLTFDDGYVDNLTQAEPLLKEFGFRAVIFLLANHQILENSWDANSGETPDALMSLEEKKRLDPHVWEIGSHGFDHLHLTEASQEKAWQEMSRSRMELQKDFNREIWAFAYPFGSTNEKMAELCQRAGYQFAVNTDQGGLHLADQPFSLFRVNVFPEDGPAELWKKTSSWYRKYFFKKRKR